MQNLEPRSSQEGQAYVLPSNGLRASILIGFVGGIVALAVPVTIVLINASLFNQAANAASKGGEGMSYQMAVSLLGWQCFGTFVELLIAFAVGIVAGRIVVKRWLGFIAGAVAGGVVALGLFFAQYIPGYPGVITTNATGTWLQYILGFALLLVIYGLLGGLMSLVGAWLTTRTHPYYSSRQEE